MPDTVLTAFVHVRSEPILLLGQYYVQCSCDWVSEGLLTEGHAREAVCAYERASLETAENRRRFERAQQIAE